jgi:hypothetical protein
MHKLILVELIEGSIKHFSFSERAKYIGLRIKALLSPFAFCISISGLLCLSTFSEAKSLRHKDTSSAFLRENR